MKGKPAPCSLWALSIRTAACLLGLSSTGGVDAAPLMPPGAFLRRPVSGSAALNRQIARDTVVSDRYARLLHLSPKLVRHALGDLHPTRLPQTRLLEVYYVD